MLEPIIITNVIPSGCGFAVRVNGGDPVYIPAHVSDLDTDRVGEEVLATLVENARNGTPYKATFLDWERRIKLDSEDFIFVDDEGCNATSEPIDENSDQTIGGMSKLSLDKAIMQSLKDCDCPMKCSELAREVQPNQSQVGIEELDKASDALKRLHERGSVAIAHIRTRPEETLAVFWAARAATLVGFLEGDDAAGT